MLSTSEKAALDFFRSYMVNPGEMLCFQGPQLEKHGAGLRVLAEKDLVVKERFAGGYSLTPAGFAAMSRGGKSAAPANSPSAASQAARRR